ncbi:hypothetical protein [Sulfuracidifex tepidarius]|nr:hypothetical protein [Sulfuracidifex tepidarius]
MDETEIRRELNIIELKIEGCNQDECEEIEGRLKELMTEAKSQKMRGLEERISELMRKLEEKEAL